MMNKFMKPKHRKTFTQKVLVAFISAALTSVMTTGVSQASDIDLYQAARSGDITLMFMLDISGSMVTVDSGQNASRLSLVKTAMVDVLQGNTTKKINKISDDKILGLSTFDANIGIVRIPARRLDTVVSGKTQRQILIDAINGLTTNQGRTPTANAYADVASYMMGTTTKGLNYSGFSSAPTGTVRDTNKYLMPSSLSQTTDVKKCSGQGIYVLTDGEPNQSSVQIAGTLMKSALNNNGFNCSNSLLPEVNNPNYGQTGAWSCIGTFSQSLLSEATNPAKLSIKTAVVGFGSTFNSLPSYSKDLTQEQNIRNINNASVNSNIANDIRNAARWGIYGGGGWYSGSSSQDVVNSINEFINSLATEIPPVTTGSPTIPNDALYPAQLQNKVYYPQFSPTPDKTFQLWAGNLKKYKISSAGFLVDKNSNRITDTSGKILDNYDFWSPAIDSSVPANADENTLGSQKMALMGGVKSQLLLKKALNATVDNRKLLTNRIGTAGSTTFANSLTLRQVSSGDIADPIYKNDPNRGYLITLLGYKGLDVTTPANITATSLTNATELRQVGAVMHSSPILLTNAGKITAKNNVLTTENRQDYVLFGTTQGLLHVVDAETGKEKFAFVPNEMVENQKQAFLNYDSTTGGLSNMYYGVDGPWTAYTEYVMGNNQLLTVGSGLNSLKGMQMAYGGLRMGGRSYYALDLQNIDNPKLKFQIDPANKRVISENGSKTYLELQFMGQSWSKPQISWVRWNGQKKLVMFVGGGYDAGGDDGDARTAGVKGPYAGYESDTYNQTNGKGSGVYMFDAQNGDLLWWAGSNASNTSTGVIGVNNSDMKYSVVSEIRTVDSDEDGLADNLYFGDLGGQVWRVDLDNKAAAVSGFSKKPVRLVNLNKGANSPRFYDMPAFSVYDYTGNKFAVVSIGSGNRSKPLAEYTYGATNYDYDSIYNIYDKDVARSDLLTTTSYNTKDIVLSGLQEITASTRASTSTSVAPYSTKGWYFKFKSNLVQSAKVMGTPVVMNYKMYVSFFDASKPGLSGDCGAGVKGESFLSTFCMPFGQCDASTTVPDDPLGAGIQTPTVADKCEPGQDCGGGGGDGDGGGSGGGSCTGTECKSDQSKQYCISTGGRILLTSNGSTGGSRTRVCLTPLKWYEKVK